MPGAIVAQQLTKSYGAHVGIAALDLQVEEGEVVGFLGANGAGKTTTLRCLVGLLHPSSGNVQVLGLDPIRQRRELMPRLGYLPGELRLYQDLTGREHIEILGDLQRVAPSRQDELCERLQLSSRDLDRPVRDYSRGMKQKIGLVQALQHDPRVIFLDEPTEGLDPLVQETFFALISEASARGCAVFLSSHVMSEVERACDRVAIVRSGRLVTMDSVEALRGTRSRSARVRFPADMDHASVPVEERWHPQWNGDELRLSLAPSDVVPALRAILALPVEDVVVEEAGLEEALLAYYGNDVN